MSASDAEKAKAQAEKKIEQGKEKAVEVKNDFVQRLREDGVLNPRGLFTVGFGPVFSKLYDDHTCTGACILITCTVAAIPLANFIAQPNGVLQKVVNGVISGVGLFATAGRTSVVPQHGKIAALSSLFLIATYAFGGAMSAAAIDSGNQNGRDNAAPRKQTSQLSGLPLRLFSATSHTFENFASFGLVAALAQAIAPTDSQLINLLGLHVLTKLFVYGPAYIFDVNPARTVAHIVATSSVVAVGLKLINKPLL